MASLVQRALVKPVALLRVTNDRASYRELMRLRAIEPRSGDEGQEVELRLGRLGGRPVWVREGTPDVDGLWSVFTRGHHLPPARVQRRGMHLVWELGANIGLAMADMALRWPEARVIGVESDADNAALARRNVEAWDDRCEVVEAAAWPATGDVWAGPGTTLSLDDLLERCGGGPVAYVLMDLEGAERELLSRDTGWAAHVGCIKVAVHGDYTVEQCAGDLERLGFDAKPDRRSDRAVVGVRDMPKAPRPADPVG